MGITLFGLFSEILIFGLIAEAINTHKMSDGVCDLDVLNGLTVKELRALTVCEYRNVLSRMIVGVILKHVLRVGDQVACLVVCGDKNEGVGIIERKVHKSSDSLVEANYSLECFFKIIVVGVLVNMRLLIHKEEAVLVAAKG